MTKKKLNKKMPTHYEVRRDLTQIISISLLTIALFSLGILQVWEYSETDKKIILILAVIVIFVVIINIVLFLWWCYKNIKGFLLL